MTASKPPLAKILCVLLLSVLCIAQTKKPPKKAAELPPNIVADPNMPVLHGGELGPAAATAWAAMRPAPKTPKEVAERIKQEHPFMFVVGKIELHTDVGKIATLYEDGRIEMEKGHTLEELTWLILWSTYANK